MSEMMKQDLSNYVWGFVFSFVSALGVTVLAAISWLFGRNSESLTGSVSTLVVFFAVPIIIGALLASLVAMTVFALASQNGQTWRGALASMAGVILLGFVFALVTQQIPDHDVTSFLIIGCCASALAGPMSFIVARRRTETASAIAVADERRSSARTTSPLR